MSMGQFSSLALVLCQSWAWGDSKVVFAFKEIRYNREVIYMKIKIHNSVLLATVERKAQDTREAQNSPGKPGGNLRGIMEYFLEEVTGIAHVTLLENKS